MHALPSSRLGFPVFNSRLGQLEHEVLFIYLLNELCNFQTKMPKHSCSLPPYTNGSIMDKIIVAKLKNTFSTSMISCTATAESPGEEKGTRDVQYDQLWKLSKGKTPLRASWTMSIVVWLRPHALGRPLTQDETRSRRVGDGMTQQNRKGQWANRQGQWNRNFMPWK